MYQKAPESNDDKLKSNFVMPENTDIQVKSFQSCSSNHGRAMERLVLIYEIIQYIILFGSITMLIALRVYYNFFIMDIRVSWTANGSKCFRNFTVMAGVMYAISTLGIVEFFLFKDSIKKLASPTMSIRAYLKLTIEAVSFIYLIFDVILVFMGLFTKCDNTDDRVWKAQRVLIFAAILYTINLISMILYLYMRRIVQQCETQKLYFEHNIQINY